VPKFVAYYRVSTAGQGVYGLGGEAQRETAARFVHAARLLAAAKNRTPPVNEVIEFVRTIRDRGESFRAITQQVNDLNIKTGRGSVWYPKTVRALLLQQAPPILTSHLLVSTCRRCESPEQQISRGLETA
jgi:hypothetical protein